MKMRKGWTLLEVLTVVAVLAIASVPLAKLTTVTLCDIPRSYRVIQSNTSILNALKQIRRDVNFAKDLSADNSLIIEQTDCTIIYQLLDGKIIRSKKSKSSENRHEVRTWLIPKGKMDWKVWRQNNRGYAVEIETHIAQKSGSCIEKKMKNSYLYFIGAYK